MSEITTIGVKNQLYNEIVLDQKDLREKSNSNITITNIHNDFTVFRFSEHSYEIPKINLSDRNVSITKLQIRSPAKNQFPKKHNCTSLSLPNIN